MDESKRKCRVCWKDMEKHVCVKVTTKWAVDSLKTIKDVILLCVPWMTIQDENFLCKPCLWQLKFTYDFIDTCLKTENILNEASKNNKQPLRLEEIFEKSLKGGNKIQIIFDNHVSSQSDDTIEESAEDPVIVHEDNQNVTEKMNIKIQIPNKTLSSEHDYCRRKGTEILVDISKNKKSEDDIQSSKKSKKVLRQYGPGETKTIIDEREKENIFVLSDDEGDNNDDDNFFNDEGTVETIVIDSSENDGKPKKDNSQKNYTSDNSDETKRPDELKDLLDIAAGDFWFLTAYNDMSAEQQEDLVRDGVNILNMSTDPNKKKRTIYMGRNLLFGCNNCTKCNISFLSRWDYLDHDHLHRKGKFKTPGEPVHKCDVCSETFTYDLEFRLHTRYTHGISSPHRCKKCNRRFKTFKLLKDHHEQFKDRETCRLEFKCKRCNREFSNAYRLRQHEEEVKDVSSCNYEKCNVCLKKFSKEEFKIHSAEVHPNFLCQECGKSFHKNANLKTHIKAIHQNKEHCMCHECGQLLSHPRVLEHHMQAKHGDKIYMCDKCPRQFATKVYLKKHSQVHMENRDKPKWKCEQCGKAYFKVDSLRIHQKVHTGVKDFICPLCNEGYIRKDHFKRHLNFHAKYSKNTCPICKKCFLTEWRLVSHGFAGHDENGKSLESRPVKKLPKTKMMKLGGQSENIVTYKYACKICNKLLSCKENLKSHYRAHLRLKKHRCNICGVMCQTRLALTNHMKLHADPNYEFSCNICHAYKSSKVELEHHMLEVHKNKKYKCSHCPEAFGRTHLLESHVTLVHKEENVKKEMLLEAFMKAEPILIPTKGSGGKFSRKGLKQATFSLDINKAFKEYVVQKSDGDAVQRSDGDAVQDASEEATSVGDFYSNYQVNQTPTHAVVGENVVTLSNEYRSLEDARACRILEEENRIDNLYIRY